MKTNKHFISIILSLMLLSPLSFFAFRSVVNPVPLQMSYTSASTSVKTGSGEDFYGESGEEVVDKANVALGEILTQGQSIIYGLIGLGLLSSTIAFVFTAYRMALAGDAKTRAEALKSLIAVSITTACLGGFGIIYSLVISVIV